MITIRSYLKQDDAFVPVETFSGTLRDEQHIEGAIELVIGDTPLLTRALWDDVDQLWDYTIQLIETALGGEEGSTFFPDQPIEMKARLTWGGRGIELEVDEQRASVARDELVVALQEAGRSFFSRMIALVPANEGWYRDALTRLGQLRA